MENFGANPTEPMPLWLFGIPVDAMSFDQTVNCIVKLAAGREKGCHYVSTSNVDFLVKALTWLPGPARHTELVDVLRQAEINTADGMPLVWVLRLLGGAIPARVSGSDLVPELMRLSGKMDLPIYLLGGREATVKKALEVVKTSTADLLIAGYDSPYVYTEGGEIAFEFEKDEGICQKINGSGAKILLIGFGNPKQEIWYQRNANRLQPGAALGVGGTFNFLAGEISRAPEWMQRAGLEWVFRFLEEPGRLWKRYAVGLVKFAAVAAPVLTMHWAARLFAPKSKPGSVLGPFISGDQSLSVVVLPARLTKLEAGQVRDNIDSAPGEVILIDATQCEFIDAAGLGALWSVWKSFGETKCLLLLAPNNRFRWLCRIHRAWEDFLALIDCKTLGSLAYRLRQQSKGVGCYVSVEGSPESIHLRFLGGLTLSNFSGIDRETLVKTLGSGNIDVDLTYCHRIDADGLGLLLRISDVAKSNHRKFSISNITPEVRRSIHVAGLSKQLSIRDREF